MYFSINLSLPPDMSILVLLRTNQDTYMNTPPLLCHRDWRKENAAGMATTVYSGEQTPLDPNNPVLRIELVTSGWAKKRAKQGKSPLMTFN